MGVVKDSSLEKSIFLYHNFPDLVKIPLRVVLKWKKTEITSFD